MSNLILSSYIIILTRLFFQGSFSFWSFVKNVKKSFEASCLVKIETNVVSGSLAFSWFALSDIIRYNLDSLFAYSWFLQILEWKSLMQDTGFNTNRIDRQMFSTFVGLNLVRSKTFSFIICNKSSTKCMKFIWLCPWWDKEKNVLHVVKDKLL